MNLLFTSLNLNKQERKLNYKNVYHEKLKKDFKRNAYLDVYDNNKSFQLIQDSVLFERFKNKTVLILRFTEIDCKSCIDSIIRVSSEFFPEKNKEMVILTKYSSERDYHIFKRLNLVNSEIINLDETLKLETEKLHVPYLFLVSKSGQINHIHIPDRTNLDLTRQYLKDIKNRYF